MGGFCAARAMSTRNDDPKGASRPYDVDRDGFVMSNGAGTVVLEGAPGCFRLLRHQGPGNDVRSPPGHASSRRHLDRDLAHQRAAFDLDYFPDKLVSRAVLHRQPPCI